MSKATLGGGCFWCLEAIFQRLPGVEKVVSGYAGGHVLKPTYNQVCSGKTGHAEVVQITFKPSEISYKQLLDVFWQCHDPTTPNRQGADHGTQYRSIIMYHDAEQEKIAKESKDNVKLLDWYEGKSVVTEIVPLTEFYPAEDYHQNYFNENEKKNSYCRLIRYKLDKLNMK
ncbi:hypothetical protein ABK040_010630 [Willaertia magna]